MISTLTSKGQITLPIALRRRLNLITAVDTSVLIAIDQGEADAEAWVELLAKCREQGALVVCDIF